MDVVNQIVFLVPFIIMGCVIIFIIIANNYKSMKFKWKLPTILLMYTIAGFTIRFLTGFWTDLYYKLSISSWVYTPINAGMLMLARSTKISLALSSLTIFRSKQ